MKSLVVMRRPGILVVSGIVSDIAADRIEITNRFYGMERRLILQTEPATTGRLNLTRGAMIIASTSDDFRIEMLMEGATIPDDTFELKAYTVRYNGSFDFEAHGQIKEQHVFAGSCLSAVREYRCGRPVCVATIGWRSKGRDEIRNVIFGLKPAADTESLLKSRIITVTGAAQVSGSVGYYPAIAVFNA